MEYSIDFGSNWKECTIEKAANRLAYYEALDKAHTLDQLDDFLLLVGSAEEEALNKVLSLVDGESVI
jgi:hypothetical protein